MLTMMCTFSKYTHMHMQQNTQKQENRMFLRSEFIFDYE